MTAGSGIALPPGHFFNMSSKDSVRVKLTSVDMHTHEIFLTKWILNNAFQLNQ